MDTNTEIIIVAGVCVLAVVTLILKKRAEWMLNFIMRSILGIIAIYFINEGLGYLDMRIGVGVNPITVLTTGILGFPGLLALYGIGFYKTL